MGGGCLGRLCREAGGRQVGGEGGRELLGHITDVWDEVGGGGEGGLLPGQPDLVRAIPGQKVQVVHEN